MTTYCAPTAVQSVIDRAEAEPCDCRTIPGSPDDPGYQLDQCFGHYVIEMLQPTVEGVELPW